MTGQVFQLPDMKLISTIEDVDYFPQLLSSETSAQRQTSRGEVKELVVADLGEVPWTSPYLIVSLTRFMRELVTDLECSYEL